VGGGEVRLTDLGPHFLKVIAAHFFIRDGAIVMA
jgi:hypothetical protein